jgi:ureidoglycolate lyase
MELIPQPLTKEAFAPFGDVIDVPDVAGRTYYEDALGNLRPTAHASLSVSLKAETPDRPLRSDYMERHEFSSQTFVPLDVERWLIVVAPHAASGGPDVSGMKAFIATGKQGVTYRPDTWPLRRLHVARRRQGRRGVRAGDALHHSHSLIRS